MKNVLILGAAGQISQLLTDGLLKQTDAKVILYARNAAGRLKVSESKREIFVDGDFNETDKLVQTMQGVDIVYVNDMRSERATQSIVAAMNRAGVKRIIAASVLGIYHEVAGAFGRWNERMVGSSSSLYAAAAKVLEDSALDYTLLRLTWLYNQEGNIACSLTQKEEPFIGAQVTRQAVAQLVIDIIQDKSGLYSRTSLGVSEPNTDWPKPSFY